MAKKFEIISDGEVNTKHVGTGKRTLLITGEYGGAKLEFKWKDLDPVNGDREGHYPNSNMDATVVDRDGNPLTVLEIYMCGYPIHIVTTGASGTTNLLVEII